MKVLALKLKKVLKRKWKICLHV